MEPSAIAGKVDPLTADPDPVIELRTRDLVLPLTRDRGAFIDRLLGWPDAPVRGLQRFFAHQQRVADTLWSLLDEPSTGLHETDLRRLSAVLAQLADKGHLIVAAEHRASLIAAADESVALPTV